jgi:hypothetical protein
MMHVEIDDGDAFGAMDRADMECCDPHRVEQAEAHGARPLGVMAWRAHGAERVLGEPGHDLVDGVDCCSSRPQSSVPASRRDDGVWIEPIVVAFGNRGTDPLDIGTRMEALDGGKVGERSLLAQQKMEALLL